MKLDQVFSGFNMSAMGMSFQRERMNVISENLANLETTRSSDGGVYKRKIAVPNFENGTGFAGFLRNYQAKLATTHGNHILRASSADEMNDNSMQDGIFANVVEDDSAPIMEYNPAHPDADANGMVQKPNINLITEMVDMISASKGFEANVVAINAAKGMAKDSLDI